MMADGGIPVFQIIEAVQVFNQLSPCRLQYPHKNQSKQGNHSDEHKAVYIFCSKNSVIYLQHVKRQSEVEQINAEASQDQNV